MTQKDRIRNTGIYKPLYEYLVLRYPHPFVREVSEWLDDVTIHHEEVDVDGDDDIVRRHGLMLPYIGGYRGGQLFGKEVVKIFLPSLLAKVLYGIKYESLHLKYKYSCR